MERKWVNLKYFAKDKKSQVHQKVLMECQRAKQITISQILKIANLQRDPFFGGIRKAQIISKRKTNNLLQKLWKNNCQSMDQNKKEILVAESLVWMKNRQKQNKILGIHKIWPKNMKAFKFEQLKV